MDGGEGDADGGGDARGVVDPGVAVARAGIKKTTRKVRSSSPATEEVPKLLNGIFLCDEEVT
jgi:hypothetical protein